MRQFVSKDLFFKWEGCTPKTLLNSGVTGQVHQIYTHSTTGGPIATRIVALTPPKKITKATDLVNFDPVTPVRVKDHSLGGSSIASL